MRLTVKTMNSGVRPTRNFPCHATEERGTDSYPQYATAARGGVFPFPENTWETDGRYHARQLAKRGDDTHGELTNKACYVSTTREP